VKSSLRDNRLETDLHADDGVNEEEHRNEQNDVRQRLQQQHGVHITSSHTTHADYQHLYLL